MYFMVLNFVFFMILTFSFRIMLDSVNVVLQNRKLIVAVMVLFVIVIPSHFPGIGMTLSILKL